MIDAHDVAAMAWADEHRAWLARQPVLWVDAQDAPHGHMTLGRPVRWAHLSALILRAIDEAEMAAKRAVSVLVVDDSSQAREQLRAALDANGYDVTAVESGKAAVAAAGARDFACVLMDVSMPGLDGYDACRRIKTAARQAGIGPAIVLLASKTSPFDPARGKVAGGDAHLTKPVRVARLLEMVARQTARRAVTVHAKQ
jgi:CheY-like chemotaxis protein